MDHLYLVVSINLEQQQILDLGQGNTLIMVLNKLLIRLLC